MARQVFDEQKEVQRVRGRGNEIETAIERGGGFILGMHHQGADAGNVRRVDRAAHRVFQQPSTQTLSLPRTVDGQPVQRDSLLGQVHDLTEHTAVVEFNDLAALDAALAGGDVACVLAEPVMTNIGMVLQDTWMFGGTIRENIAYGNLEASEEQIVEAARATYVDRFVRSLPDGYDTVVDDEGGRISAGEKQLMTIARAFLADPAILILDEATSHLDNENEAAVQVALEAALRGRTALVIAHRLSTVRRADRIVVLDAGHLVEEGTHEELMERKGLYAAQVHAGELGQ